MWRKEVRAAGTDSRAGPRRRPDSVAIVELVRRLLGRAIENGDIGIGQLAEELGGERKLG